MIKTPKKFQVKKVNSENSKINIAIVVIFTIKSFFYNTLIKIGCINLETAYNKN